TRDIALLRVGEGAYRLFGEEDAPHRAERAARSGEAGLPDDADQTVDESAGPSREKVLRTRLLENPQLCQAGRHRERITRECPRLVDGTDGGDSFHDVPPTSVGTDRKPAA